MSYNSHHKSRAQSEKQCRRRNASSGQKTLEYVRIYVIYRVNQAVYVIHIRMAAPQEYLNTYSTPRVSRL